MRILARLFEHNNWANRVIIRACGALSEEQLDAQPSPDGPWSIRTNLVHLVKWQQHYLDFFASSSSAALDASSSFDALEASARASGAGLLELALHEEETSRAHPAPFKTSDGYRVEPWVLFVQALNHGAEHRKQIAHLMRNLDVERPTMDGWGYGEAEGAVVRVP